MSSVKKGLTICFLGPDGSGKSTVISGVENATLPFDNTCYFHLKPIVKNNDTSNVVADPHKYPPYSVIKSYMKLGYFILQYNWGWFKNIRGLLKKGSLIIFDRYYDDLLVDTKRYRYGGDLAAAKMVRRFIPKPDVYFVLDAPVEVIRSRKKEVGKDELERQLKAYRLLVDGVRYVAVDVNRPPEAIVNDIVRIIRSKLDATD